MAGYGFQNSMGSQGAVEAILRMVAEKNAEQAALTARSDKLHQQDIENDINRRSADTATGHLTLSQQIAARAAASQSVGLHQGDEAPTSPVMGGSAGRFPFMLNKMQSLAPIRIPGVAGAGDTTVTPDNKQQLDLAAMRKIDQTPVNIGPDETFGNPSGTINMHGGPRTLTPPVPRAPQVIHGVLDKNGNPVTRVESQDGTVREIPEYHAPSAQSTKPPTGVERQTRDYYTRMRDALDTMNAIESKLSPADVGIIQSSPLPEFANNLMLSAAGKQYAQALRSYTLAKLRKESGAAISAGEFSKEALAAARNINDTPEVIAQKRAFRERVAEGFAAGSGKAYEEFYGHPYAHNEQAGGGFTVKDPTGKDHHFDTQAQADAFKKLIGG